MLVDHLLKTKKRIQKFKETGHSIYIYQNKLEKFCFQHDIVFRDFKSLPIRTGSAKVLCKKPVDIAKKPEYVGYQRGLASIAYKFLDKNSAAMRENKSPTHKRTGVNSENQKLTEEVHKPITRKFEIHNVCSLFKE